MQVGRVHIDPAQTAPPAANENKYSLHILQKHLRTGQKRELGKRKCSIDAQLKMVLTMSLQIS